MSPLGHSHHHANRPRVAVVHDYLTQRGGAERVALAIMRSFPNARLITSVYNPETTFAEFADFEVETLWTDRVAAFRKDPRRAFPFLAHAFSSANVADVDVVVCSSSGWAHGIGTDALKVVYCHNPARWLYQPEDYAPTIPRPIRPVVTALAPALRTWDARQATTVDRYLANSTSVRGRIERAYGRSSSVLHPPPGVTPEGPLEPVPGLEPGYLLHVGRPRQYKNADVVCAAVAGMPEERLVCVGGLPQPPQGHGSWPANVIGLEGLSDAQLRWLYANCRALLAMSQEDFGLTPIEAYSFGRPVVALAAGGYLDSTVDGVTGVLVDQLSAEALRDGIRRLDRLALDPARILDHAETFAEASFAAALRRTVLDVWVGEQPVVPAPRTPVVPRQRTSRITAAA